MPKRLLFICYWSVSDNLTMATVLPRLQVLQERHEVDAIVLVTIERETTTGTQPDLLIQLTKVKHLPYLSGKRNGSLLEKVSDFIHLPAWLVRLTKDHCIDTVLAHSAPAGALAYKLWEKTKLPFYVSSFEPHSLYMLESGVWEKYGLKYRFQAHWEEKQKKVAAGLMPVAHNYKAKLLADGVADEKVFTVPCTVNVGDFNFSAAARTAFREKYNWQDATIGIYVGKFGSLYYKDEAFLIFKKCFSHFPDFRLIILTPENIETIKQQLSHAQIDLAKVYISAVAHKAVPEYLSAADFAFAPYKPGPSKKYLSPIKTGEYWASGLPVLLTEGIGDDSAIIEHERGGALFNLQQEGSLEQAFMKIQDILKDPNHRQEIPKLAHKYRSPKLIKQAYNYFFGEGEAGL